METEQLLAKSPLFDKLVSMYEREFTGGVFSDEIAGGRAGAEIELAREGVVARTPEGQRYLVPFGECQIEVGGFSGRMVFCRNRDRSLTIFCEERGFPQALSAASIGLLDDQLQAQLATRRRSNRRSWQIGVACLAGIIVLLVAGYFAIRFGAKLAVQALPVSVDRQIGEQAFKTMDLGGPEVKDPRVTGPLQAMVDRMAPHAAVEDLDFKVHVVRSPEANAFALPGGNIVVFTGLIRQAKEAGQVAGVLGHEMAHATLRHGLQRIGQAVGIATAASFLLGDTQGLIAAGAELFQLASINSYSREHEAEADAEGVRMMHEAGIDPMALPKFFAILQQQHGDQPDLVAWIGTHPQHRQRIEALQRQIESLPKRDYQALDVDWADIQQRVE